MSFEIKKLEAGLKSEFEYDGKYITVTYFDDRDILALTVLPDIGTMFTLDYFEISETILLAYRQTGMANTIYKTRVYPDEYSNEGELIDAIYAYMLHIHEKCLYDYECELLNRLARMRNVQV